MVIEDEARVFVPQEEVDQNGNLCFYKYNSDLKLKAIHLGALSNLSDNQILKSLPVNSSIRVERTRLAFREFHVVKDKSKKTINLTNA